MYIKTRYKATKKPITIDLMYYKCYISFRILAFNKNDYNLPSGRKEHEMNGTFRNGFIVGLACGAAVALVIAAFIASYKEKTVAIGDFARVVTTEEVRVLDPEVLGSDPVSHRVRFRCEITSNGIVEAISKEGTDIIVRFLNFGGTTDKTCPLNAKIPISEYLFRKMKRDAARALRLESELAKLR